MEVDSYESMGLPPFEYRTVEVAVPYGASGDRGVTGGGVETSFVPSGGSEDEYASGDDPAENVNGCPEGAVPLKSQVAGVDGVRGVRREHGGKKVDVFAGVNEEVGVRRKGLGQGVNGGGGLAEGLELL